MTGVQIAKNLTYNLLRNIPLTCDIVSNQKFKNNVKLSFVSLNGVVRFHFLFDVLQSVELNWLSDV